MNIFIDTVHVSFFMLSVFNFWIYLILHKLYTPVYCILHGYTCQDHYSVTNIYVWWVGDG